MLHFRNSAVLWMPVMALAVVGSAGNLTGIWVLDAGKSSWGKMNVPSSVIIEIDQEGDSLHYTGTVTYANEDTREFAFIGAIDGKEYLVMRSFGAGKMTVHRTDPWTLRTEFRSDDGAYQESSRIVLSGDGTRLTRYMSLKSPLGPRTWIEVYRRRR